MAAGTAVQVYGQIKGGNAAKQAGEEAGKLEDYNAFVEEQAAKDAETRGALDEQQFRQQIRGTIGKQRAGFASQGVDVGAGSALDVQADAAYLGELDALTIRNNAAREAHGYRVEAERAKRRGKYARLTGQQAQAASRINAVSTVLSSAGSIAGSGLQARYMYGGG